MEIEQVGGASDGAAPRLVIKDMELENFKSYAGKQRVGPFHKCFSSVVGPNGSGKSNVIDAMMFVFGKRAKQLRLNKVSELIHNSTNHCNLGTAKVTVTFVEIIDLEGEDFEVVPNSELVVTRTAHSDNSSNYYVNDRKSSFTKVTELLKHKGVDLDNNRFLILQGEVEQISMMKPKAVNPGDTGLLEYLEDIIGTDKYVEKIEEMSKSLEEMNEKRQGMVSRVKIAEKERDGLEGSKLEAEQYMSHEKDKHQHESLYYQKACRQAQVNLGKIDEGIQGLNAKLGHEKEKLKEFSAVLKEAETRYNQAKQENDQLSKELESKREQFKEFERKDIKLREDMKHLGAKKKKTTTKMSKDEEKMKAMLAEALALEQEVPLLEEKTKSTAERLAEAEAKLEEMQVGIKDEVERYSKKLQDVRMELAPWEKSIQEVSSKRSVAVAERDLLHNKHESAVKKAEEARSGVGKAREAATHKERSVKEMQEQLHSQRAELEEAQGREAAGKAEVARLETAVREVRGRVEERRSAVSAEASRGAVVRALLAAKSVGEIEGIYGRLGDLGAIDGKYDIAVSTACGALDYIVVSTTSAAQRCVDLLRRNNLGVATFLILEKQQHLAARLEERVSPPEGVPRLFDLVRCQDKALRPAFYFALRDTVVANDLQQAGRIAYGQDKRWRRVVTLKGEVINESGTMTGGGGRPSGGRMTLGDRAPQQVDERQARKDLESDEVKLEADLQALRAAQQKVQEIADEARKSQRELARLETAIPKAKMEAESLTAQASDLEARLGELDTAAKQGKEDKQRLNELEKEISGLDKEVGKLQSGCKELNQKAGELQACIANAGGMPLKKQKQLTEQLAKEADGIEAEITKKRVQAASNQKQASKLGKEIQKAVAEVERITQETEDITSSLNELDVEAGKVVAVIQEEDQKLRDRELDAKELKEEFEKKQKEVSTITGVQSEIEAKLEELKGKKKEQTKHVKQASIMLEEARQALQESLGEGCELPELATPEDLDALNSDDLLFKIEVLNEEMRKMNPDMSALEAYKAKTAEYESRVQDLEAATAERDAVRSTYETLRKKRLDEFMSGFNTIGLKLKEMYQMITMGGDAELELVDSLDPFSEGIVFSVRPPRKSWKNISNLSGGEKTLSSLSLVFALHYFRPTPLYFMDEIDAALDFKNVSIVAHYIKERTRNAQFVIISLRNNMFELADRLVGIYKTDNCTKSVAINPAAFTVGLSTEVEAQENQTPEAAIVPVH